MRARRAGTFSQRGILSARPAHQATQSGTIDSLPRPPDWADSGSTAVIARPGSLLDSRTAPAAARFAGSRIPAARAGLLPYMEAPAWTYLTAPLNPRSSSAIRAVRAVGDAAPHS